VSPTSRPWRKAEPGKLVGRGHAAGDFLEAWDWDVLETRDGFLRLECSLPDSVRNPRGQLFGGFTPTYVDFVALHTVHAGKERSRSWLATTNMRVDYFDPVVGPRFRIESQLVRERGRTCFVETRFLDLRGKLLVFALTTMRRVPKDRVIGDA
jgi:acyl-coenzyme A thioesterase PaaI-like protein